MKVFFRKLVLGSSPQVKPVSAISSRIKNIKAIWNNEHDDDMGIEKMFRLFLAATPFIFPGVYLKEIAGRKGLSYQDLTVDMFVLFKVTFPLVILFTGMEDNIVLLCILLWFMMETVLYVPTLIFASDSLVRPRSYRRSMLLLFFNYLEIIFDFAVIYSFGNFFNKPFQAWFDPIYFSFITSASIGYGDFFPVTPMGKMVVSCHSIVFLIFVVVFLNFFSSKMESKGYFGDTK
ncbi:potassium channel protein [Cytophagales bacterium WSM2-2]|nr:potassium channel protein [Cytophagales bacterium WSM2-2]